MALYADSINTRFGAFCFAKVLVNDGRLRLAETNKVDDVGKDGDKTIMSWFRKVRKGEVGDTALEEFRAQKSSSGPVFTLISSFLSVI